MLVLGFVLVLGVPTLHKFFLGEHGEFIRLFTSSPHCSFAEEDLLKMWLEIVSWMRSLRTMPMRSNSSRCKGAKKWWYFLLLNFTFLAIQMLPMILEGDSIASVCKQLLEKLKTQKLLHQVTTMNESHNEHVTLIFKTFATWCMVSGNIVLALFKIISRHWKWLV